MASKAEQMLRARKEAKQKKVLFVLVPLFLALVAWQGPKTFHTLMGSSAAPAPPAAKTSTTSAATGQAPDPSSAPAPSTAGAGTTATPNASGLPDTDPRPQPGADQLGSLSLFTSKDPFIQQADAPPAAPGSSSSSPSSSPSSSTSSSTPSSSSTSQPSSAGVLTAHMTVNGTKVAAGVGDQFPREHPFFRVAALTSTYVKIGLVSGSYANGASTQKVALGRSVTFVKQPEGTPYKIVLVRVASE